LLQFCFNFAFKFSCRRHIEGVSQLRHFLERLLQQRYLENVPTIVPVLEREHRAASVKLKETAAELEDLDCDKLKVGAYTISR
jgi:hypothetical protein